MDEWYVDAAPVASAVSGHHGKVGVPCGVLNSSC